MQVTSEQEVTSGQPNVGSVDDIVLETRGLTKEFRGFVAVKSVDFQVRRGSIHALIGPNGAGKTTFFNLLTHFLKPSSGQIFYNGEEITHLAPYAISRLGIVRSFQISSVFSQMSVRGNVRVALQRKHGQDFNFWSPVRNLAEYNDEAEGYLDAVGLLEFANVPAVELSYGRKRALEIATTLALDPKLILLDEPTQGMGHEDIGRVVELIRKVSKGRTVLMVEHNMGVVSNLCDRITVLQRGERLAEGSYAEVAADPKVKEAYMGTADV